MTILITLLWCYKILDIPRKWYNLQNKKGYKSTLRKMKCARRERNELDMNFSDNCNVDYT